MHCVVCVYIFTVEIRWKRSLDWNNVNRLNNSLDRLTVAIHLPNKTRIYYTQDNINNQLNDYINRHKLIVIKKERKRRPLQNHDVIRYVTTVAMADNWRHSASYSLAVKLLPAIDTGQVHILVLHLRSSIMK